MAVLSLVGAEDRVKDKLLRKLTDVNRELWLLLSLIALAGLINFLVLSNQVLLGLYALPTVFSAYFYGRRHAVATAVASVLLVIVIAYYNPNLFATGRVALIGERWFSIIGWGASLMITAFAMGTLYERDKVKVRELRRTYEGVLMILRQFISKDKYTQNHSYRVSIYATQIAVEMGFNEDQIEDVRAAALLHDIGKLEISREILYKAAQLTEDEYTQMREHVNKASAILDPVGGSLRRVLPLILSHHDHYDGTGYTQKSAQEIPLGARILAVADAYDAIISDRPYRKGSTSFEAREVIEGHAGSSFDPDVVNAFLKAFRKHNMEIPEAVI